MPFRTSQTSGIVAACLFDRSMLSDVFPCYESDLRNGVAHEIRAASLQNETPPEKLLNQYEKRFEKREKGSEKRSETRPKNC